MSAEMQFYLVAVPAVILLGLSKGGFSGLSSLAMPMISLVASPVRAAAIVLPILIVQDWVSVWAFRRDYSLRNLIILTPSAVIGVTFGWLLAARVSEDAVRLAIGVISIAFVAYMLIRDRLGRAPVEKPGVPSGVLWGSLSGFTSFVSHAGGAAVPGLCHAAISGAANIRRHRDDLLRRCQPVKASGLFSPRAA
jgi:uncharacterized protein